MGQHLHAVPEPSVDEQAALSAVLSTGVDFSKRTIYLVSGEVGMADAGRFMVQLAEMEKTEGPIRVVLTCAGGAEPAGWAIYDALRQSPRQIVIDAIGCCWSMGAVILQGGFARRMSKECRLMMHAGTVQMGTSVDQRTLVAFGVEAKRTNRRYERVLSERTGIDLAKISAYTQAETYFSARQALRRGFIDAIIPYAGDDAITTTKRKRK